MALKLIQGRQLLGLTRKHLYPPVGLRCVSRLLGASDVCVVCLWTTADRCIQRWGCQRLQRDSRRRGLSTIVRDPFFFTSGSFGLHRESVFRFRLTQQHRPTDAQERDFKKRLASCSSLLQVFSLLQTFRVVSDTMAAAMLHHVADLEQRREEKCSLKDPTILDKDTIRAVLFQLEQDSKWLTDSGLVSALLACTRLYLDPWSTLVVRLVSESQERLDGGQMTVRQLCTLGQAMLALEGPGCVMLQQVMEQVQRREPAQWSLPELTAVYSLLQDGVGNDGRYEDLLNAMHAHAVSVTSYMNPAAISVVLGALMKLSQYQAMPLLISLCKQAASHVPHFSDEELLLVLGAMMHVGHSDSDFVEAMERHTPEMAFTSHPEAVAKVMQYFGRTNILSLPVFNAVAESFVFRADEYTTSQVARQIMPFGKLGYVPPNARQLFRRVETILHKRFSQFRPHTLLNLVHSFLLVERFPVNFVSKVLSSSFLQQLEEEGTGIDQTVRAQLTQLHMTMKLECPSYKVPWIHPKYLLKSFSDARSLETSVDAPLCHSVRAGLLSLLGTGHYFRSKVLTKYCYTLDIEIKLDKEGFVLPSFHEEEVYKRVALCVDDQKRFTIKTRQLLGKEAIKQRHLRLLGYEVVQIPFYEFEKLQSKTEMVQYLHKKIFPCSYRLTW